MASPAQTPTVQDCPGSIAICQSIFSESNAYTGTGNIHNEIDTNSSCLKSGERNDVWYTFTVVSSGNLCFTITPNIASDDYDWAVFNLTSASCSDIPSNSSLEVSCNFAPNPGPTGPNGLGGPQNEACIAVNTGERYVVNVSQFTVSLNGYTIDFSASSASIYDNTPPSLSSVDLPISCGTNTVNLHFSEKVVCSSVTASDFQLSGPGASYSISNLTSAACSGGDQTGQDFTVTITPPMKFDGSYNFCLNGAVNDLCGNVSSSSCISFSVSGVIASITGSTNNNCFGAKNGTATADATNGSPPYSYSWNTVPSQNAATATGLGAGNFTVTVTDAAGCAGLANVVITSPVVIPNDMQVSCDSSTCDASASVTPLGGTSPYSYQWYDENMVAIPGETSSSTSNLCVGAYCVVTTDANSCADTTCVSIQMPSITLAQIQPSCPGDCDGAAQLIDAGGTPPLTFEWQNPLGTPIAGETDSLLDNLCAGMYYFQVTTATSCVLTDSIDVTNPAPVTITMVPKNACNGTCDGQAAAVVTGGTTPYSYKWDTPDSSAFSLVTGLCAGNYNVTVTDSKGCSSTSPAIITEAPPMTLTPSLVNTSCSQPDGVADVMVSGGSSPYTYRWDANTGNQVTQSATGLAAGSYYVVVTDNIGCRDTAYYQIGYSDSNTATITVVKPVSCTGVCDGEVLVTIAGGTPPYTYAWNPTKDITSGVDSVCADTMKVTATDSTGCPAAASVVMQDPLPVSIDNMTPTDETSCNSQNGSVDITVSGGTPPYSYLWSTGAVSQDVSGLAAGTYSVTVTDSNNCPDTTGSATLTPPPPVDATVVSQTQETSCNSGDASIDISVANGQAPYTYIWSNGSVTEDVSGLYAGAYSVTVTDVNNCPPDSETITIQPATPIAVSVATITPETTCNSGDASVVVTVANGALPYTYQWSNGQTQATATGLTAGTYSVSVTDINQCPADSEAAVVPPAPPIEFSIAVENVSCTGFNDGEAAATVNSGGEAPYTYNWSTGQTGTSDNTTGLAPGTYSVSVTDINQCTASTESLVITEPPPLTAAATGICEDTKGSVDLTVSGGTPPYGYLWATGEVTEDLARVELTKYNVTVTDANGCTITSGTELTPDLCTIFIPTVFTPNGNGTNDAWDIDNLSVYPDCKVKVFNRWGDVVFKSNGYEKPWDGKYLGIKMPTAVYYYIITIESIDKVYTGTITVMQ